MINTESIEMIERPIPWPGGAKCAVSLTFDIDTDSFLHLEYHKRVPDMVATTSWVRYDEVAVLRLLRIYKAFDIKQTFFFPAWCMENYAHLVEQILNGNHEIAHHGYLHENPNQLTHEDESAWLDRGIEVIERMTGEKPRGYRAPIYNFSRYTADLLAEKRFIYDASLMADDIPYVLESSSGDVIELPSHWALDDWPQFAHNIELQYMMSIRSPDEAFAVYESEFESAYRNGGFLVGVRHPWLTARLARAERLVEFIRNVLKKGDVWIAPMEEIACHVANLKASGREIRRVGMPYYSDAIEATKVPRQVKSLRA